MISDPTSSISALIETAAVQRLFSATAEAGGEARLVGGVVRDCLLGVPLGDLDMASTLSPQDNLAMAEKAGLKAVPTGMDHGTITFVIDGNPIEVTTLRRDVATDGRRALVSYTDDWQEDAARRDFTLNALYLDSSGQIHDFFGGLEDLEHRRIRFIGDAGQRISEDYLRVLRYFRFHAQLETDRWDENELAACQAAAANLPQLSIDRVQSELKKLLSRPNPTDAIEKMSQTQVLAHVLPGLTNTQRLLRVIACEANHGLAPAPLRRLAAWSDEPEALAKLKLSKAETKRLKAMFGSSSLSISERLYRHGAEAVLDQFILSDKLTPGALSDIQAWQAPKFPLQGKNLLAAGWQAGPTLGEDLARAEQRWIETDFQADTEALVCFLRSNTSGSQ